MINFRIAEHSRTGATMVEVWRDGEFVAAIYGHDKGVRVMSKYFDGVCYDEADGSGVDPEKDINSMSVIVNLTR